MKARVIRYIDETGELTGEIIDYHYDKSNTVLNLNPSFYFPDIEKIKFPEEFGNLDALRGPDQETMWGGEPAAEEMTKYLHPQIYTIYTTAPKIDLMLKAKLIPDQNGMWKCTRSSGG